MIDSALLSLVKKWADENYKTFRPNGFGRQYGILQNINTPKEVWEIKEKVVDFFKLHDAKQEPIFKDYCGYIKEGGAIHKHTDINEGSLIHTRFNVMISKPIEGGEPVQNNIVLSVNEGDVWRCDAGKVLHWCTPVIGNKPRIVLSFGFLLEENNGIPKN
jgi:hypothetical protein